MKNKLIQCFNRIIIGSVFSASLVAASTAQAKDLTIGLYTAVTSMDPHFFNSASNNSMSRHIFETLIRQTTSMGLEPGLALEWKNLSDTVLEIKLRPNVKWHDGSAFTADDVVFTFQRAPNVPNSPSSFSSITSLAKVVKAIDPLTVHIITESPKPLLVNYLSALPIISKKAGENAKTEDYNSGKSVVGTGPYRFSEFVPNTKIVIVKNEKYWGEKEPWDKVTFKFLGVGATRIASILSREVDLIDGVPPTDMLRLTKDTKLKMVSGLTNRLIYLHLDSNRDKSPFVTDKSGKILEKNPLRDAKVRKAMSMAINRAAIVGSLLESKATVAAQYMPDGFIGISKNAKPEVYDPTMAKQLLAQAGYPDGFSLVIHSPLNRYVNDAAVAQVLAQLLTRVGITTKVETMPASVYFTRANKLEFSVMLSAWGGADVQENIMALRPVLGTFNKDSGAGVANRGRYSNKDLDQLIDSALNATSPTIRADISAKATDLALADTPILPLYFEHAIWSMTRGLNMKPRLDSYTLATGVR